MTPSQKPSGEPNPGQKSDLPTSEQFSDATGVVPDEVSDSTQTSGRQPFLTTMAVGAAKHWRITVVAWIVLLIAGGYAYSTGLAREGFPAIEVPIVVVEGAYFADDAEVVDADVSEPLVAALSEVEGVESVGSFTRDNGFFLIAEFDDAYTAVEGAVLLEAAGTGVAPEEALVFYRGIDVAKYLEEYDVLVSVVGDSVDASAEELQLRAVEVADYLNQSDDVAEAVVQNVLTPAVDPATGEEVIRQTDFSRTYGSDKGEFRPSVMIGLNRSETGLDTIGFSEAIHAQLDAGDFADVQVTGDFAVDIQAQLKSLQSNLLTGLVAVAAVSFLLIGWRTALVTSAFMITVVAAAFLVLWIAGYSLNTITLFALILTIGLLVDDAVVVAEAIDANRNEGETPLDVVRVAITRVGRASMSGTLTTVLVFMPLLFVTGIIGKFIRVMPITVIITLLVSFVLSIILISALAGAFLLKGKPSRSPIVRLEDQMARWLQKLASTLEGKPLKGFILSMGGIALSFVPILIGLNLFGSLGFNVFPPGKDSNLLQIEIDFDDGTTIERAQSVAAEVDAATVEVLGDELRSAQYVFSDERGAFVFVDLTPYSDRSIKSPVFVEQLTEAVSGIDGAEVTVDQLNQGPPSEAFPFSVEIAVDDNQLAAGEAFALELTNALSGATITRTNGETATILETEYSSRGQVFRTSGQRVMVVAGRFDADDVSALLDAAQAKVEEDYPAEALIERGLSGDALVFDFGLESENTEGFESIIKALGVALVAMVFLLMLQFRSIVQPLLIVIAIPFSFLGVGAGLSATDNPLSFLVMIGLIGLIGVVVNNTILLTDAANQARREGATPAGAIGTALRRRFRPLVATTLTTVAGLAPLAISDPFWQPMAITIMVGLVSSTILVLVAFPFYYRAVEYVRVFVVGLFRRA